MKTDIIPIPPSADTLRWLHSTMVRVRVFEDRAGSLVENGVIPGFVHLYVGQEAVGTGVIANLRPTDVITSTHRGHGHLIAKGAPVDRMFAELFGKRAGFNKGKGGSVHISDLSLGSLGANGIVGGGLPIAVGAAFASKYQGRDDVVVSFFGDGATNIGMFHEALNMASLLKLPVVFVCENNLYGEYTAQSGHQAIKDIADRAAGYGLPGVAVDGMDATAVYEVAAAAVEHARDGQGPSLIEAKTYRFYDHQGVTGMRQSYRDSAEEAEWRERDPIPAMESFLLSTGVLSEDEVQGVWESARAEVEAGVNFAESSAYPDVDEILSDVYSGTV